MQLIKSAYPSPTTLDSYVWGTRLGTVFKILALLVLWLGWSMPARAQALVALPYTEDGIANGAPYEIIVPGNWKDTDYSLVVFLHGYNNIDCPLQLPITGYWLDENGTDSEPVLLGLGYALAASSYSQNGYAVKQGFDDTRDLIEHFKSSIGRPGRTILVAHAPPTARLPLATSLAERSCWWTTS